MIQKKSINKTSILSLISVVKEEKGDLELLENLVKEVDDITVIKVQGGQVASYKDSIYRFIVQCFLPEEQVEELCKLYCRNSNNKLQGGNFNGSCSFPFGLNSFYRFNKLAYGVYEYTVCEPYTG